MAFVRCSVGRHQIDGKAATVYVAWRVPGGDRLAYKLHFCAQHYLAHELRTIQHHLPENDSDGLTCSSCGITIEERDAVLLWSTDYLPKREAAQYTIVCCEPCSQILQHSFSTIGELLPDRGAELRGPSTPDPWRDA